MYVCILNHSFLKNTGKGDGKASKLISVVTISYFAFTLSQGLFRELSAHPPSHSEKPANTATATELLSGESQKQTSFV